MNSISRSNLEKLMTPACTKVSRVARLPTTTRLFGALTVKLFRPEPLQRRDITLQGGEPFLIVERAHLFFVRGPILFHAHPQGHANEQKEC